MPSHIGPRGAARMVDVGGKAVTRREAVARAWVQMQPGTLRLIVQRQAPKGDVLATARIAGIQAAKRTSEIIPLCHPIKLDAVRVEFRAARGRLEIETRVRATDRTGVEMEAMSAAAAAALTVYDMLKGVERGIVIGEIRLDEKRGGKSGEWTRARVSRPRATARTSRGSPSGRARPSRRVRSR